MKSEKSLNILGQHIPSIAFGNHIKLIIEDKILSFERENLKNEKNVDYYNLHSYFLNNRKIYLSVTQGKKLRS